MDKKEWIKRCEEQFDKRVQDDKATWNDAAEACYESMYADFPDDPEDAADEEMSNWDDDA
jgi:hypothetical protein